MIENNVRTAADLDPAFLASVKQHGVLLPTIGYRNADGAVVVRDGQMRVLAACEAAVAVPVFVTARDDSTAKRIAEQLVANERRTALTDGDRLAAYRQLEIEGLSVTAIARETGTKRDAVKQTLTVAKSDAAATAVASGQATFTQALILSEFDGDADAVTELTEWIAEGYDDELTHVAAARSVGHQGGPENDHHGECDAVCVPGSYETYPYQEHVRHKRHSAPVVSLPRSVTHAQSRSGYRSRSQPPTSDSRSLGSAGRCNTTVNRSVADGSEAWTPCAGSAVLGAIETRSRADGGL
ncbi:hypothetical protein KK105_14610 [Curtobacterium flaccumfaciens pv. betae]|nr:hypothetical protein [Curtobacterium flaccumfaciens]MBT1607996.1 hypothetical protein [Curtobacterium flaccumfaciens pv. betae]MCX2872775.1 hypothetical protein [Curtobacterium flaccumfaciens pv. betae]UWD85312.1 hypothetical protein NY059_13375 [Curtobacterium flaccumfaciens pv. betae]UWT75379.1 hypothetical protein N3C65_05925 [Curtobacterium flaccumfaciens pv. betae]